METVEREDFELSKWALALGVVTNILVFYDLFLASAAADSVRFVAGVTALAAGFFNLIRHKKFKSPSTGFRSAVWLTVGAYFFTMAIVSFVSKSS